MGRPGLQQRGQQQLLGRYRWPAFCGVELAEGGIEPIKGLIRQLADPPQRMAGRDPLLDREEGEQGTAALLLTSHHGMSGCPIFAGVDGVFSERLRRIGGRSFS
jgi:hypothetical protein